MGLLLATAFVVLGILSACADQVRMVNGDQYFGRVISVDSGTVVLQSAVLGELRLPRTKVSALAFGATPAESEAAAAAFAKPASLSLARTNSPLPATALSGLGKNTNLIAQVRRQFLADAGPEANAKFDELLTGLMSGQLSMGDLRSQAKTAADQLRAARKELGPEAGDLLDGYLAILDKFLNQPEPASAPALTPAPQLPPSKTGTGGR